MSDNTISGPPGTRRLKKDWRTCAYCAAPRTTRDHVPPASVFGDLLRNNHSVNLITVPSCAACNHSETKDDTYFRDALSLMAPRIETPIPEQVRDSVKRSVRGARAGQFRTPIQTLMSQARPTWRSDGLTSLLQRYEAVPVRWDRIRRTVERTAKGLYWHHFGARIPEGYDVDVIGDKERDAYGFVELEVLDELAQSSLRGTKRIVHPEVFMYSIAFTDDDPQSAVLVLCFYQRTLFFALVGPVQQASKIVLPR